MRAVGANSLLKKTLLSSPFLVGIFLLIPIAAMPGKPTPGLWISPREIWGGKSKGELLRPLITSWGTSAPALDMGELAIIAFQGFASPNSTLMQLNGVPWEGPFKINNRGFSRKFKSQEQFLEFVAEHLRDNYFDTILDLSHWGALRGDDFEGHLRRRMLSAMYPEARIYSVDGIVLVADHIIDNENPERDHWLYQISAGYDHIRTWTWSPYGHSYSYHPRNENRVLGAIDPDEEDFDSIRVLAGPGVFNEYSSQLFARLTRNGRDSKAPFDRADGQLGMIARIWGDQFQPQVDIIDRATTGGNVGKYTLTPRSLKKLEYGMTSERPSTLFYQFKRR